MLDFSTALSASASSAADYQIEALKTIKRVRKTKVPVYKPVAFTVSYSASTDSVTLTLIGQQTFPKGGQITVLACAARRSDECGAGGLPDWHHSVYHFGGRPGIRPL